MSWAGCQNNPIYLNFYLQKSLEIFEKNSADKFWSNKDKGIKMPCPMPDRVKVFLSNLFTVFSWVLLSQWSLNVDTFFIWLLGIWYLIYRSFFDHRNSRSLLLKVSFFSNWVILDFFFHVLKIILTFFS